MSANAGARPRRVLVTGAKGFVGSHVVAALEDRGMTVRRLVRRGTESPDGGNIMLWRDLTDRDSVRAAVRGIDVVVHLAARVHVSGRGVHDAAMSYRRDNVEGTRILMEEARAASVGAFIFASSVKAVTDCHEGPVDERIVPAPRDAYGVSKLEAEGVVAQIARAGGMRACILRLPLVYGPGMKSNVLRLFRLVDMRVPLPLRTVRNRRSVAFVGKIASAISHLAADPPPGVNVYFVSDRESLSTPALISRIAAALERRSSLFSVPTKLLAAVSRIVSWVDRRAGGPSAAEAIQHVTLSLEVDSSRFARETAFVTPFSTDEGLRMTALWYRTARVRSL